MAEHSTIVACPHCGAPNQSTSAFCESCGKALPGTASATPRILTEAAMPATGAGRQLMSEELQRQLKKAKGALLTVAIMQTIFAVLIIAVTKAALPAGRAVPPVLIVTLLGIAIIFFGLYAWSRRNPLPAAIAGLTVFVTLHVVDGIVDPTQIARGLIVKMIIVAVLVQAIQAGIKFKRLQAGVQ